MSTSNSKAPIHKIRVGNVTANIWARQTEKRTFYAVTTERGYKDAQDKWQSTSSIDTPDIQNARKAMDLAHNEILKLEAADREINSNAGEGA